MFLYIYYQQTHIPRNTLSYLLSGDLEKNILIKNSYYNIINICKNWKSIHYKTLDYYLILYKSKFKNLDDLLKFLYPDLEVIFYYPHNKWDINFTEKLSKSNYRKIIYIDDMHSKNPKKVKFSLCNSFDKIFCSYAYKVPILRKDIDISKVIAFPHYMCDHLTLDPINNNIKKKTGILLSGFGPKEVWRNLDYTVRHELYCKYKTQLKFLDVAENIRGSAFYSVINSSLAAISTPGNIGYIVAKYFEIPSSNTLLLAYDENIKKDLEDLGFIDNENYISFNMDNIQDKINFINNRNNIDRIREITKNGYNLIKSKHLLTHRVILLDNICKELIN